MAVPLELLRHSFLQKMRMGAEFLISHGMPNNIREVEEAEMSTP